MEKRHNLTRYGILRREHLKNHCSAMYQELLWTGGLWEHFLGLQEEAEEMHKNLKEKEEARLGVTEALKRENVSEWIRRESLAEEAARAMVLRELVYTNPDTEIMGDPFGRQ